MPKQIKHNAEEKKVIVKNICNLYETNEYTIESCADACGIDVRTFNNWVRENTEHSDLYKAAKKKSELIFKERLRKKAMTSLEKLVEGFDYEEVSTEGRDVDGKFKAVKQVKKTIKILPNPTLVQYALNNSNDVKDHTFNHASKTIITGGKDEEGNDKPISIVSNLSDEALEIIMNELSQK